MTAKLIQSRKAFLALALLVVVALCSVAFAYAQVTAGSVAPLKGPSHTASITLKQEPGIRTLPNGPLTPWYSRLEINSASYSGPAVVTWKIQQKTGFSSWTDVSGTEITTSIVLSGNVQNIYASNDGAYSPSNHEWGQYVTTSGTYRVVATVTA